MTPSRTPDFELTTAELREVTRFAATAAERALPIHEADRPDDPRPREALDAAWEFANGAPRSRAQRVTGPAAHRSAKDAGSAAAAHAAMAAGDAAASAYLHPLADAAQVGHILRAPAHAICAFEQRGGTASDVGGEPVTVESVVRSATPLLVAVLRRYPRTGPESTPVSRFLHQMDAALREDAEGSEHGESP